MTEFEGDAQVREQLKSEGIFEAHRLIAEYKCHRKHPDGDYQDVVVRIFDMGPESPRARYSWNVTVPGAESPEPIPSNTGDTVQRAGHVAQWNQLDSTVRRGRV